MNKKFSTLLLAFLAAGYSVTVEAGVVKVAKPVEGKSYVIGEATGLSDGKLDGAVGILNATAEKDAVEAGIAAKGTASVSTFTQWLFTATVTPLGYRVSLDADANYLATASADEMTVTSGAEGVNVAKDTWVFGSPNFGAAFAGTTTAACTDQIKFEYSAGGATVGLNTTGSSISFYADAHDANKSTGLLTSVTAGTTKVYISVGGKYLAVDATNDTKLVWLDAIPSDYDGMLRASWTWVITVGGGSNKTFNSVYLAGKSVAASFLLPGSSTSFATLVGTAQATTDFTFDNEAVYQAQKGARLGQTAGFWNGASWVKTAAAVNEKSEILLYQAADVVTAPDLFTVPATTGAGSLVDGTKFVSGKYYVLSGKAEEALVDNAAEGAKLSIASEGSAALTALEALGDKALWKVEVTKQNDNYIYTFTNKKTGNLMALDGQTSFTATAKYTQGVELTGVTFASGVPVANTTASALGFYQAFDAPQTVKDLADIQIAIKAADGKAIDKGYEWGGETLTALGEKATDKKFQIRIGDVAEDGSYNLLALAKGDAWGGSGTGLEGENDLNRGYKLVSISSKELKTKAAKVEYYTYFSIKESGDNPKDLIVEVYAGKDDVNSFGRLFVAVTPDGTSYLTTTKALENKEVWPAVAFGAVETPAFVDLKTLLKGQFIRVSYVKNDKETEANVYKVGGILSVRNTDKSLANANKVDYVPTASVLSVAPEAQWALTYDEKTGLTLTNRENTNAVIKISKLANTKNVGVYKVSGDAVIDGDLITIEFVEKATKYDGYEVIYDNVLMSNAYNLGQYRNTESDVNTYWSENHDKSHQIGATVDKAAATQWRLNLVKKTVDGKPQIDTAYVISKMDVLKNNKIEEKADTLAIFKYAFQNLENSEFVKLNGEVNLHYYICDEFNKNLATAAVPFALKQKPNNAYNYVVVEGGNLVGSQKVHLANSAELGAWENTFAYGADNNALMVLEKDEAPMYRKIAKGWGDVVRIYREEYPTEELFEKIDEKSVVGKDTLSFLNVSNSIKNANPALFIDTAYVDRVDENGIGNVRYQYLLGVNVDTDNTYYCPLTDKHNDPEWIKENGGPCQDAKEFKAVKGRFLINLVDTAFAYKKEHIHNNPYVNMVEADENLAKLSFVEGIHSGDTLYITRQGGEVVKLPMDSANFNVAKFAFRYVDHKAGSFKIQTQWKDYQGSKTVKDLEESASDEGYLRWVNGTVVVTNKFTNGELFNMEENYDGDPVANEDVTVSSISVVSTNGAVIIKGAAGKKVAISNLLGQTVASTVISSDNATIAAPAGIVVVAVEGEAAVKAIVK